MPCTDVRSPEKKNHVCKIYIRLQNSRLIIGCDNACSDNLELSGSLPAGNSIGISSILDVCRGGIVLSGGFC